MLKLSSINTLLFLILYFTACNNGGSKVQSKTDTLSNTHNDSLMLKPDFMLQPGEAAGKIKLGEDTELLFQEMGRPDSSDAAMQKMVAFWYEGNDRTKYSTAIYASRDTGDMPKSRVKQIRVTAPNFKTANGVGIGSILDKLKEAFTLSQIKFNKDTSRLPQVWDSKDGIAFEIDSQHKCSAVIIHQKDEELKPTYLPLR
ncbi:hypothetical protein A5893_08560 [Pedobacter psychrophilus]|uniref:Lipoprotein n=1 Tax=Pedobacter psychrophilus TaxID=1826909 RepID=A0A179DFQ3_9SPHI|nr:hypothetical protein [Pedobacter psychrophilus]OAQ39632.1 hypothetical protein A5893_08560 [Pedobacter psychrophilus]